MHDRSSKPDVTSGDPLNDMLRGLRLDGVDYWRCKLSAPWGFSFPAQQAARFHFVAEQGCWLRQPDGEWVALSVGDAVLLPRGAAHALASAPDVPTETFGQQRCTPICGDIFDFRSGGDGASAVLFCCSLHFNLDGLHPLLRMMPDVMRATELIAREPAVLHLLEAMGCEVAMERVGAAGIAARMADVLAATIIRSWVEGGCGSANGWIAAVRNPDVGRVLAAIHLNPDRDWTVAALAGIMGASRSSFADRFAAIVGETPARYVAQVRMHQARQWIQRDRARISDVARRLGYDSEAAFSRAFKRVIGTAPSHLRGQAG
ncbi:MAG: AraC family transcriptional regulator [Rhizobiales bacterium]|nr:AraC family transcriptional regulator [Hyphomicrobiales bacterium]